MWDFIDIQVYLIFCFKLIYIRIYYEYQNNKLNFFYSTYIYISLEYTILTVQNPEWKKHVPILKLNCNVCKDIHTFYSTASWLFKKCIRVNWNMNLIDRCLDNSDELPTFHAMNCMFQKRQNVKCRVLQNADLENRKT